MGLHLRFLNEPITFCAERAHNPVLMGAPRDTVFQPTRIQDIAWEPKSCLFPVVLNFSQGKIVFSGETQQGFVINVITGVNHLVSAVKRYRLEGQYFEQLYDWITLFQFKGSMVDNFACQSSLNPGGTNSKFF